MGRVLVATPQLDASARRVCPPTVGLEGDLNAFVAGFFGDKCEISEAERKRCRGDSLCSDHGVCNSQNGKCSCEPGWVTPAAKQAHRDMKETMTVCRDCSCTLDRICSCDRDPDSVVYHPPLGRCFSPPVVYPGDN